MTEMKDDLLNWASLQSSNLGFNTIVSLQPLREQASLRNYFRIETDKGTKIGVISEPRSKQNKLFKTHSNFLLENGISVPAVEAYDYEKGLMILEDFGDKVLKEAKNAFTRLLKGETFDQVTLSGSNSALKVPDTLMNLSKVREYIGPSLMREAQLLKPGQFSEPKKVSDGYKIIYLVDREDAAQPEYSNIRSSVLSEFSKRRDDQSLRTYLDNLKKWYDVSRNLEE